MKWAKLASLGVSLLVLSGCSGSLSTIASDTPIKTSVKGKDNQLIASMVAMPATRRMMVVSGHEDSAGKFCAEAPPPAATQIKSDIAGKLSAQLDALANQPGGEGNVEYQNTLDKTVKLLSTSSEKVVIFQTGAYAICQYYLAGALNEAQVGKLFSQLITATTQPSAAPATAK